MSKLDVAVISFLVGFITATITILVVNWTVDSDCTCGGKGDNHKKSCYLS